MSELWLPGMSGPLDELVSRIQLRIEAFAAEQGAARVDVELRDGSSVTVRRLSSEPGAGFLTLCPHTEDGAEEWIVPVGAVSRIRLSQVEKEEPFGFSLPAR